MATYLVERDDYAGWNPTGRNFAMISAAIGAVGLLSWMSLHSHLGAFRPSAASDQLFLEGLVWLGIGGFCLMAFAALGSILLSLKSRGSVSVTAEGVFRTVDTRTRFLAWAEIEGLVPMPYGGVTLVAAPGKVDIVIPRFLDDYRACIAEIKNHSIRRLPPSSLRRRRKTTWIDSVRTFFIAALVSLALNSHASHRVRIATFSALIAGMAWMLTFSREKTDQTMARWVVILIVLGMALYILRRMTLSW
jgi:hypothetical protein